jgi:hypothetical protein
MFVQEKIDPFENPHHIRGGSGEIPAQTSEADWKKTPDWLLKKFDDREGNW